MSIDQIKASTFLGTDRTHSIRQAIIACRKGGRVSMPAVYGGFVDKFPLGAFMEKGLTLKTGQTHVQHYMPALLNAIMEGKIDTTFLISHRMALEDAPKGYKMFHDNQNEVTKVVLKPGLADRLQQHQGDMTWRTNSRSSPAHRPASASNWRRSAAENGYDLLVVADEPLIDAAAQDFRRHGGQVTAIQADLATVEGVDTLLAATMNISCTDGRTRSLRPAFAAIASTSRTSSLFALGIASSTSSAEYRAATSRIWLIGP